jgi:putative toxin-antitoxin system antitoxin component (TIGR02293 family)
MALQTRRPAPRPSRSTDPIKAARQVRAGLPFSQLLSLERTSGFSREAIAVWVGVPIRTLARRQVEGRLGPDESDRLSRASRIFQLAVELFEGDTGAARRWLESPQAALDNQSPLELSTTDIGAREVEKLIGRLEHGVFA